VLIQALLQTLQIGGFFMLEDKPPKPPGPQAHAFVPFHFYNVRDQILKNKNAIRLLLALGILVVPWATYFSLLDQV